MEIVAFVLALVAVILFLVVWAQTKSLEALGLAFFVAAFIAQLVITGGTHITVS